METKHFSKLRGQACNWLVPPNIQSMMSGVKYAQQLPDGTITLFYTDDTTESAHSTQDMVREFDGFFSVVSYVQSKRASI